MKKFARVVRDKKGKLSIKPQFVNRGCYFYWIPKRFLDKVMEGFEYLFKFGPPRNTGKVDKKGKKIYTCVAIPIKEFIKE